MRWMNGRWCAAVGAGLGVVVGMGGCGGGAARGHREATPIAAPAQRPAPAPAPAPVREAVAPPVAVAEPEPVRVTADDWRPAWWIGGADGTGGTLREAGIVAAGGMATEGDVLAARRGAVGAAMRRLEGVLGGGKGAENMSSKIDTLQLPDGRYRAFVVVSVPNS